MSKILSTIFHRRRKKSCTERAKRREKYTDVKIIYDDDAPELFVENVAMIYCGKIGGWLSLIYKKVQGKEHLWKCVYYEIRDYPLEQADLKCDYAPPYSASA